MQLVLDVLYTTAVKAHEKLDPRKHGIEIFIHQILDVGMKPTRVSRNKFRRRYNEAVRV
jgi:hypothetical protein